MRIAARILCGALVPLASLFFASVGPSAQKKKASEEEIKVLANLPLQDMKVNQMFVKEYNHKTYLYLHQPKEDTYALVDVTNSEKPTLVNRDAIKGSAPEGPVADSPILKISRPSKLLRASPVCTPTTPTNWCTWSTGKACGLSNTGTLTRYRYVPPQESVLIARHR